MAGAPRKDCGANFSSGSPVSRLIHERILPKLTADEECNKLTGRSSVYVVFSIFYFWIDFFLLQSGEFAKVRYEARISAFQCLFQAQ